MSSSEEADLQVMEKFCPLCSRVYGVEVSQCEVDGERLVVLKEEPSLVGHVLDNKYTLLSKLGEGGMGSVYLAEQSSMGREVAIKVLRREFSQNRMAIKRFLREARAASKLTHPNTITVYDFGQSNEGLLYLVMERLSGRPLADILDDDGRMPVQRAVHIIAQVCDSLSEAHAHGITHRDLKPENIFIEQKVGNPDFVKVLDFGIAKMQGEDNTQATATGMICGTPSYMSPEQAMGRDIDGRSDIYALGILLYEMLTDVKPFEGDTPMEVMLKHINESPEPIVDRVQLAVPVGVQETIDRMLAKAAEDRPLHCQELKRLLIEGLASPLVEVTRPSTPMALSPASRHDSEDRATELEKTGLSPVIPPEVYAPRPEPRERRPFVYALAAVAIVALGGLAAWLFGNGGGTPGAEGTRTATPSLEAFGERPDDHVGVSPEVGASAEVADAATGESDAGAFAAVAQAGPDAREDAAVAPSAATGRVTGQLLAAAGDRGLQLRASGVAAMAVTEVTVTVRSTPDGATVYDADGNALGETPLELRRPQGSGELEIVLKRDRYNPRRVTVFFGDTSVVHDLELTRARRAPVRRPPSDTTKPPEDEPGEKPSRFPTF